MHFVFLENLNNQDLTVAQGELLEWIKNYINEYQHSPSIRQMMEAMSLKSPAPIQSRLKHLQMKGLISWQEGKARTLKLVEEFSNGIPILGAVAAGGIIETFNDVQETLDIESVANKKGIFALTVNGDSMVDAYIADGDTVLMEPVNTPTALKNGTIVSAYVEGLGATLKYYNFKKQSIYLEAANPNYEPLILNPESVLVQGKLLAVWRSV